MKTREGVELASRNACLFGLVSFFPLGFPPQKAQESVLEYVSAISCAAPVKVIAYKSSNNLFSNIFLKDKFWEKKSAPIPLPKLDLGFGS